MTMGATAKRRRRILLSSPKGYGHRDATMILIGYRHGLRASELCDLQWSQVELATGRLHVRRAKNGWIKVPYYPKAQIRQGVDCEGVRPISHRKRRIASIIATTLVRIA